MSNPEFHACPTCGYRWRHGQHGGHDCASRLVEKLTAAQARIAELEAELHRDRLPLDCHHENERLRARVAELEAELHHIITTAAVCLNWHAHKVGERTRMRPGKRG